MFLHFIIVKSSCRDWHVTKIQLGNNEILGKIKN